MLSSIIYLLFFVCVLCSYCSLALFSCEWIFFHVVFLRLLFSRLLTCLFNCCPFIYFFACPSHRGVISYRRNLTNGLKFGIWLIGKSFDEALPIKIQLKQRITDSSSTLAKNNRFEPRTTELWWRKERFCYLDLLGPWLSPSTCTDITHLAQKWGSNHLL